MAISASVGINGKNNPADVKKIQILLNQALKDYPKFRQTFIQERKREQLKQDSDYGPNTENAIIIFQKIVLNFKWPDGLIDVGGSTWKKLNGNSTKQTLHARHDMHIQLEKILQYLGSQGKSYFELCEFLIPGVSNACSSNTCSSDPQHSPTKGGSSGSRRFNRPSTQPKAFNTAVNQKYRQGGGNWGQILTGNSNSYTLSRTGCLLTCYAMATTVLGSRTKHWPENLKPEKVTPKEANQIVIKGGGFSGGSMKTVTAATPLGMKAEDTGRRKKLINRASHLLNIDNHLRSGGLVCAHVHYRRAEKGLKQDHDWAGDHWVLMTGKNTAGEYTFIDPGDGKSSVFSTEKPKTRTVFRNDPINVLLYGTNKNKSTTKTSRNRPLYEVVRYIKLSSS